ARRLGVDVLTGRGKDRADDERMQLAVAASQIDELFRHLDYETTTSTNTARGLRHLRRRMLALLPLLASIRHRRLSLDTLGGMPTSLGEICTKVARWLDDGGRNQQEAGLLRSALHKMQPTLGINASWNEIVAAGLVTRLRNLVEIMQDCQALREAI